MSEAKTLAIIAGGVGGSVGAFVGVAVGGTTLGVMLTTLVVAVLVGAAVIARAPSSLVTWRSSRAPRVSEFRELLLV